VALSGAIVPNYHVPGLNAVELGVLAAIREHHRQLAVRGYGTTLSRDRLAHRLAPPIEEEPAPGRMFADVFGSIEGT